MYKSEWHESANANYFLPIEHLFHYHDGLIKWALSACSKFPEMQQQLRNWDFKFLFHIDLEQAIVTLAGFAFPPRRRVGQYLQCPLLLNTLRFSEESCWTAADFPFQFTWRQRLASVLHSALLLFQKISVSPCSPLLSSGNWVTDTIRSLFLLSDPDLSIHSGQREDTSPCSVGGAKGRDGTTGPGAHGTPHPRTTRTQDSCGSSCLPVLHPNTRKFEVIWHYAAALKQPLKEVSSSPPPSSSFMIWKRHPTSKETFY